MNQLEHIGDGSVVDRNFQKLMALLPDTGGQSLGFRVGLDSVSFTASDLSTTKTIAHGLGRVPAFIATQSLDRSGKASPAVGATDTSFDASAKYDSAITGTLFFYWVVIG